MSTMTRNFLLFLLVISAAGLLYAQGGAYGTILGTVTDNSGAVVTKAAVDVTNVNTNVTKHTETSSSGDFTVPYLAPGTYRVTVQSQGFQKSVVDKIVLVVGQESRADFVMKPGATTETVEVQGQSVALDTDSSALSQLVAQQQVEELPLNGRNFMQLLLIGAGAVTVGGEQGTMRQGEGNAVSINGGRPEGNNYTLDGLINTDTALVTPAVVLSQDAIQEFKVESGTYSAEYGYSASQINIISKSGGNQLHGTVFEFNRNDTFDASPFPTYTDVKSGIPTANPELRQNQFGFVVNGPVYIPKVYDGRNKTFFLANYEGWRIVNGARVNYTMPNPATLTGDFSGETYPAGIAGLPGGSLPNYGTADCTALLAAGYNCMPVDPLTGQPFPGNIVPADSVYEPNRTGCRGQPFLADADGSQPARGRCQLHQEFRFPFNHQSTDLPLRPEPRQVRFGFLPVYQSPLSEQRTIQLQRPGPRHRTVFRGREGLRGVLHSQPWA